MNGILAVAVTDSVVTLVMTQVENSDDLRWCSECEQDVRKTEERIFIAWESVLLLASPFLGKLYSGLKPVKLNRVLLQGLTQDVIQHYSEA